MPLKIYCPNPNCSSPIEYSLQKPNYCPYCSCELNAPFAAQASIKTTPKTAPIIHRQEIEEPEIEVEIDESALEIEEIDVGRNQGVKLETIAKQSKIGMIRDIPKKINAKKVMAAILEEAKTPARVEITDGGPE